MFYCKAQKTLKLKLKLSIFVDEWCGVSKLGARINHYK